MKRFIVALLLLAGSATLQAQSISVADASFENLTSSVNSTFIQTGGSPPALSGQFANPGWSWNRSGFDINVQVGIINFGLSTYPGASQAASGLATHGGNVGRLQYTPVTGGLLGVLQVQVFGAISLSQTTTALVQPNTQYTVSFDIDRSTTAALLNTFTVTLTDNGTPFASCTFADLLVLLDRGSGLDTMTKNFTTGNSVNGGNLGLVLSSNFPAGVGTDVFSLLPNSAITMDQVTLFAQSVPEPSTIAVIGLVVVGISGGLWYRRRRQLAALQTELN